MAPDIEVLAVQYPGRQDRRTEPLVDDVRALAEGVHAAVADWTERPTALFGHSMGASVAFEVANRLAPAGISPLGLFASGRRAPSRHRPATPRLHDDATVLARLGKLGGTDTRVLADEELLGLVIPIVRNDLRAAESYLHRPGPLLDCPVFVLVGDDDPETTVDEALAWRDHTTGPFAAEVFPGGHFYLEAHAEPVRSFLAQQISSLLASQTNASR
jgi:surfactin synthase thioesterase subunit